MKYFGSIGLLFSVLILPVSCGPEKEVVEIQEEKVNVLSSFSILTEMVKEVGGERVAVYNLVPIGTDPHEYEPRPADIKFASKANLFVYNGLNLEGGDDGWYSRLIRSIHAPKDRVFKVADKISPMYLTDEHSGEEEVNPHAFIDPAVGIVMTEAIRDALISADKENREYYVKNAVGYISKLKAIKADYETKLGSLPEENKVFMASEQAFQYMTHRYGLKEGYIWAIDTEENGSPQQIKAAIDFVRKYQPPVLFMESNKDNRPMMTVSRETKVPVYSPTIFSDELGRPGHEADTYLKYLEYNLKHIYNGLSGNAEWKE